MVERNQKIDEEKKGERKWKGRELAPLSPRFFLLVSSTYDLSRSLSSEHRTLPTERLAPGKPAPSNHEPPRKWDQAPDTLIYQRKNKRGEGWG